MAASRTKSFTISDPNDLDKVDGWWAALLRKGAKEISSVEWVAHGDLTWVLKVVWTALDIDEMPFNVCMPAYSGLTLEDLTELLEDAEGERRFLRKNLKLFKLKVDDWGIFEIEPTDTPMESLDSDDYSMTDFSLNPGLSYGSKLDILEKIMASEFLWPSYKSMKQALMMCDARIEEIKMEIEHRKDPSYTVVYVDRGMLRRAFQKQMAYDNKWLFATDDEIFDDLEDDSSAPDDEPS